MKLLILPAVLSLVALPAMAAPVTVTLDDEEQLALRALLDLGVKQGGLSVAGNADYLWRKIESGGAPLASTATESGAPPLPPAGDKPK